ncbi:MAG TPA: glycosyl transferase, partial [Lamprocystis sp. (in: g-proteobacteria)]|nr:glycosyl transferase [Lamprocystis sp. (in: g-proteobacteria)]
MNSQAFTDPTAPAPPIHTLSNGRYEVLISATGAGQSACNGVALTRGRADPVQDDLGSFLYLRDLDDGRFWSMGYQPTRTPTAVYQTADQDGCFVLEREDHGIAAQLTVSVDAAADLERRRLILTNHSGRSRRIEVTSYLEVVLFPADADAAHPAFAKLFVQTERDAATGALLARRRPRAEGEHWPWLVHALVGVPVDQWETDRLRFLGRGRTAAAPLALVDLTPLSGTVGNVLDPIMSLRTALTIPAGGSIEVLFLTGAAPDRAAALRLLDEDHGHDTPHRHSGREPASSASDGNPQAVDCRQDGVPPTDRAQRRSGADLAQDTQDALANPDLGLRSFNGYGGFSSDGREYILPLIRQGDGLRRPPLPWVNVIANARAGCLVSEVGAGFTWARNSQANRLTPWANDPVSDPHGEAFYVRDEAT